ncbi:MAG: DNA starvation/stationary phase protection protein [Bacteroidetes bacterium]|nr:DNA starvation/stationary phase protection protein [Bacteroidota bacterium]
MTAKKASTATKTGKSTARKTNAIGLDQVQSSELAEKLNDLLANYQIFYMNTRGFHWNIKGEKFFELHIKFEELYTDLQLKIDEIAERVLTLGYTPMHNFEDYMKTAVVKQAKNVSEGKKAVSMILDIFKVLITKQRNLLDLSDVAGDEGTNALMSDYIREQEKLVWMYSSFLG